MIRNILEYLENSAQEYENKIAIEDEKKELTYYELLDLSQRVGTSLIKKGIQNQPVAIYLPKSCESIIAFMGIVYSGGFYCPIDITMPLERVQHILDTLKPVAIITNAQYSSKVEKLDISGEILLLEEVLESPICSECLNSIRRKCLDKDPLYVLFTSGSTGVPKGVLISHASVIDFVENAVPVLKVDSSDIYGNQGDFHFDLSVLDIYCAIKTGGTICIIPKKKFMFPVDLLKYLNEKKITTINWVPSAICNVANLKALDVVTPQYLKNVFFCGEVMPNKQLNVWREKLPHITYINMYGPTEIVYACTYYKVNQSYTDDEALPIGIPFENTKIIVLNEDNKVVEGEEIGELCVAGTCLALGYYKDKKRTEEVFVNNPLNLQYEEKIYRTGDIVKYNAKGELIYLSRKDFQIKHMGHRIELGEIEVAAGGVPDIENTACIYNESEQKIYLCYTGKMCSKEVIEEHLKKKVMPYMIPQRYMYFEKFPYNLNGKVDRKELAQMIQRKMLNDEKK